MSGTVARAARAVLETGEPLAKIAVARRAARDWRLGRLAFDFDVAMPNEPARPAAPELLPPNRMPRRGKGGSERGRIALIHALAHIEFVAIDLAFDMVGRFGGQFPRAFTDDWMKVGADEAMHFALLDRRLKQLGSHYGAMPAHDGLWEAAAATSDDAAARLAVCQWCLRHAGWMSLRRRSRGSRRSAIGRLRRFSDEFSGTRSSMLRREPAGSNRSARHAESIRARNGERCSIVTSGERLSLRSTTRRASQPV